MPDYTETMLAYVQSIDARTARIEDAVVGLKVKVYGVASALSVGGAAFGFFFSK